MILYTGNYWVPFPSSEYGGTWTVIAKDEEECIDILISLKYYEDYDSLIPAAVSEARRYELNPAKGYTSGVVDTFFT